MKKITAALTVVSLIAATALAQTTAAVAQTRRNAGEARQGYQYRNRGYYDQNGTRYYDGYPLSDWEKMRDRW
jgi:hypothetical protein